jgi:hypothetical protein
MIGSNPLNCQKQERERRIGDLRERDRVQWATPAPSPLFGTIKAADGHLAGAKRTMGTEIIVPGSGETTAISVLYNGQFKRHDLNFGIRGSAPIFTSMILVASEGLESARSNR